MRLLTLPVLLFAFAQGPNDAEKAFRAAEKKLAEADAVQLDFVSDMKGEKAEVKLKGILLMTKGNKLRMELTGVVGGKDFEMKIISDGEKTKTDKAVQDTPKNSNARVARITSQAGFAVGFFVVAFKSSPGKEQPDLDELTSVSGFSFGKKEKIGAGERLAQRIDYKLTMSAGNKKETVDAQVWLDVETNLPLKRVVNLPGAAKSQAIEVYGIVLNAKIDPKKFELPK